VSTVGTYDDHVDSLAYNTGLLRSAECLGFAIACGIGSNSKISQMVNPCGFLGQCTSDYLCGVGGLKRPIRRPIPHF
jgi:hypothetical protein